MSLDNTEIGTVIRRIVSELSELADRIAATEQAPVHAIDRTPERKYVRRISEDVRLESITPRLAGLSAAEYQARRIREKHIPKELFGEPAWDMLLDLYINRCAGTRQSVSSLCIASAVPPTTALRWIKNLVDAGLAARTRAAQDYRVSYVDLTEHGTKAMSRCMKEQDATLLARSNIDPAIPFGIIGRDDYTREG